MKRRSFLAGLLTLSQAPPATALLVGDSLAYQLGPRLAKLMRAKQLRLAHDGRGGSSARQWLREGWFQRSTHAHPANSVLVSLGVNCTRSERPGLAEDVAALVAQSPAPVLWLLPPPLRMDTAYLERAVATAGCSSFAPGELELEHDGIHPTDAGHRHWAAMLVQHLWEHTT